MTEKEFNELLNKNFEPEQVRWLKRNRVKAVGSSDVEIIANYAKVLWDNREWYGKEGALKLNKLIQAPLAVYTLQGIAEAAGYSDKQDGDDKVRASEQFLEDYFGGEKDKGTRERWQTSIVDKYGEGSWKKAKKVIQRAKIDLMNAAIDDARRKEIDPTWSEASFPKWLTSAAMGLFTPRRKQAFLEGRDPKWTETLGDIGQAALYSAPVGKIAQGVKAVMGPGVASTILGNLVAQSVAPAAVVGMDKALGNKDYTPVEALVETLIGTGTNLGVGKGLAAMFGPAYQLYTGKVRGDTPKWLIDFLEGTAPARERSQEKIDDAIALLKKHYAETSGEQLHRVGRGNSPTTISAKELQKTRDLVEVGDYLKQKGNKDNLSDALDDFIKTNDAQVKDVVKGIGKDPLYQLDTQTIDSWKKPLDEAIMGVIGKSPATHQTEALKRAITSDPELLSLFYRRTPREVFNDVAADAIKTWAVNRYGSDKDANLALRATGVNANVDELRKEQAKENKERAQKASASRILGDLEKAGTELTEEDTKWLKKIEQNPGMVQGYGEGNTPAFRNWMLLRGSDLLSGTPLYRPTFEVK